MIQDAVNLAINSLIKPFEGYAVKLPSGGCLSYPDPGTGGHPWTIGWGSTGPGIDKTTVWTLQQAEQALHEHVVYFTTGLLKLSPSLINATDSRLAALISFCYNVGLGNYRISTLKKRVDVGDWDAAATEIVKWNKAAGRVLPGLTKRRKAEALLLQS
jgi:GH24 family phage-related lysozyme (muramidase)